MDPLLETVGLRGVPTLCIWEGHRTWGAALVGYSCLYLLVLRPPVCLMSLSKVMRLF